MASEVQTVPLSTSQSRAQIILALFAVYIVWGSTYLAIRIGVQGLPPFFLAGTRFIIAGGLLFLFLMLRGARPPKPAEWGGSAIVGTLLLVVGNGGVVFAEQSVGSGLTALALATTPLWAAVFAALFGVKPILREWIGLSIGFAGIVLLNLDHGLRASPIGAIALAVSSISWAVGTVWSGRLTLPPGLMASAAQMLVAGVLLLVISLFHGEHWQMKLSGPSFWALVYLIVFGALVGYSAYSYLVRTVRTALATTNAYVNPVIAVALGAAFADEKVTVIEIVAAMIILTGVAIVIDR